LITSSVLILEISPLKIRGRMGVLLYITFEIGIYYFLLTMWICLDSIDSGNWRAIFIFYLVPVLFSFFGTIFILDESARFFLAKEKFSKCFTLLNRMGKSNNPVFENLTTNEVKHINLLNLERWFDNLAIKFNQINAKKSSYCYF
jgi:MFS family permease